MTSSTNSICRPIKKRVLTETLLLEAGLWSELDKGAIGKYIPGVPESLGKQRLSLRLDPPMLDEEETLNWSDSLPLSPGGNVKDKSSEA